MNFYSNPVKFTTNFISINLFIFAIAILFASVIEAESTDYQTSTVSSVSVDLTHHLQRNSEESEKKNNTKNTISTSTSLPITDTNLQNSSNTINTINTYENNSTIITTENTSITTSTLPITDKNFQNTYNTNNLTEGEKKNNITTNTTTKTTITTTSLPNTDKNLQSFINSNNNITNIEGKNLNNTTTNTTYTEMTTHSSIVNLNNQTISHYVLEKDLNSTKQPDCITRRSCNQCAEISTCNWSIEKQMCVNLTSGQPGNITECPKFNVNFTIVNNTNAMQITQNLNYSILVNISNEANSFKTFLYENKNNIICKVDELSARATFINNETINCTITPVPYESVEHIVLKMNPLHILYFSIFVNNTQIQFENPKDQYTSYYGLNCPKSDCEIGYWEDNLTRYYCQWCTKSEKCIVKQQQNKCDIRKIDGNNTKITDKFSEIEVKSSNVEIESIEPTYGLYVGGMVIKIIIKGHWILFDNRQMIITVAGRQCMNPMFKNETLYCTASVSSDKNDLGVGPVVITYQSTEKSLTKYVLKSKEMFSFINPQMTDITPNFVPVNTVSTIKIIGDYLNVTKNVVVLVNGGVKCNVTELKKEYIKCLISSSDVLNSGEVSISFDDIVIKNVSIPQFMFANQPSIIEEKQTFGGIASGSTKLVIHGHFTGIKNPKFYLVNKDGLKYYADCPPHPIYRKFQVICYSPNLNASDLIPPISFPVGFTVEFIGQTFELISPYNHDNYYIYNEDPDFMDFVVDIEGRRITITGKFAYTDYRFTDIFIPTGKENCTVDKITNTVIECQTNSTIGTYVASRLKELKIYVGKNMVGVALRRPQLPIRSSLPAVLISSLALLNGVISSLLQFVHFAAVVV